jgi:predicted RNase H-like HicB family nuclease
MMDRELDTLMKLPYAVEVTPDTATDGAMCYLATHPELPGCMSHGHTPGEAVANLDDARRLYLETLIEKDQPVPMPETVTSSGAARRHARIWKVLDPTPADDESLSNESIEINIHPAPVISRISAL